MEIFESFKDWLKLQEDAGPLGPEASSRYINGPEYQKRGVNPKRTARDDNGESDPANPSLPEVYPDKLFGRMNAKKKCKKCKK